MTIQRREFLKAVGGATLAGSLITVGNSAAAASSGVPAFGFADDRVPMNAANLCPMLSSVSDAHARYAHELDLDLSSANRKRIEAMKEAARSQIAEQLGTSADELAIVRNTSEANNVIVSGIPLEAGDDDDAETPHAQTDMGNAERLAADHGDDVRYAWPFKSWFIYNDGCWGRDESGAIMRLARATVRAMNQDARLAKHAHRTEAAPRLEAMVKLARSEPGIPLTPAEMDVDPLLFNVENGTPSRSNFGISVECGLTNRLLRIMTGYLGANGFRARTR